MAEIIDPQQTALSPEHIPPIEGAIDMVVHRADEQYRFLHDNAVVWHKGTLFAAWYNCPHAEIVGSSCIRGRRSADGGRTWSPVEVIAADHAGRGTFYVPVAFCSCGDRLYAFVSNMIAHDQVTRCETFILDEATDRWRSQGFIADHFLPNCAPVPMEDGHYLMAGRVAESSAVKPAYPAVAISEGHDLAGRWRMVRISERKLPLHPETTVWVNGAIVTAVVRGGAGGGVHLFTSHDYGRTWEGPLENNLPAADTKLYAGTLNTGQRYLIWN